ncbi:MAG: peptide chain release factor 3 [Myxococcota bacterium]|jgi:peptide chain release factor 3|nr:peptide chain release factor 3 [Myxococcota bacterium]
MSISAERLQACVGSRRTFAIISHPDAGKTTLTEKLLLYGGAIHLAGSVKAKRARRAALSDWMEIERERGISVTTSVMQFVYQGIHINLLDTPGHNDFSEDTYRTLAAADCAVMLIDSVKGVEPQTIKLFQVCRLRQIPIVTFINKMDAFGREPMDLLDEIEKVLGIPTTAASWPVGSGPNFQGVFDRWSRTFRHFEKADAGSRRAPMTVTSIDDPGLRQALGASWHDRLLEEMDLLDGAGDLFDRERFLAGQVTPVFFGSAMNNFGVEPFLEHFVELAPAPRGRRTESGLIEPASPFFSGFVFKIQANMDRNHRDRIAFFRICSGRFERGMEALHVRTGRTLTLSRPLMFLAQERTVIEEAYAGDIVGLWDAGALRIGDSLSTGQPVEYEGIPRFSPEHFVRVRLADPTRRKQLQKGLDELSEEGAVQIFQDRQRLARDPILGAVGTLQFDVIKHRLKFEYNVDVLYDALSFQYARWVEGPGFDPAALERQSWTTSCVLDAEGRPVVLFENEWNLRRAVDDNPQLSFIASVQPARRGRAAS